MDCWVVCFWGTDPETGVDCYNDVFAESFSKESSIAAWEAVGAVPPSHACLNDKQVLWELGDASQDDVTQIAMMEMQMANTIACDLLTARGFQGNLLKAEIRRKKSKKAQELVMVPNSKERVEALSKASTHCAILQ
mmetsp:Transcript_12938/g.27456  ORF Transcript_12938/g.27456 Transcript_12938/m.27456 type:complete len:136 (-) Transcript_12938:466-873(-)